MRLLRLAETLYQKQLVTNRRLTRNETLESLVGAIPKKDVLVEVNGPETYARDLGKQANISPALTEAAISLHSLNTDPEAISTALRKADHIAPDLMRSVLEDNPHSASLYVDKLSDPRLTPELKQMAQESNQVVLTEKRLGELLRTPELKRGLSPRTIKVVSEEAARLKTISKSLFEIAAAAGLENNPTLQALAKQTSQALTDTYEFYSKVPTGIMKPFNQMADAIPVALENPEALIHGIMQQANHPEKIVNQIYEEYVSLMIRLGSPEAGTRGEAFGEFVSNTFFGVSYGWNNWQSSP